MESDIGFQVALEEARKGASKGGVPVGAALVSADGKILGQGHNMRIQKGSPILHVWKYLQYIASIDVEELIENIGWDFGSGECRTPASLSIQGFDYVHNPLTMRYVYRRLLTVQD